MGNAKAELVIPSFETNLLPILYLIQEQMTPVIERVFKPDNPGKQIIELMEFQTEIANGVKDSTPESINRL